MADKYPMFEQLPGVIIIDHIDETDDERSKSSDKKYIIIIRGLL